MNELLPNVITIQELDILASSTYYKDMCKIKSSRYRSVSDKLNFMQDCNKSNEAVKELLGLEGENTSKFVDNNKSKISETIFEYTRASLKNALEGIRNAGLRAIYVRNIKRNAENFLTRINDMGTLDDLVGLAEDASTVRNIELECTRIRLTKTGKAFSIMIKERGLNFLGLYEKYARDVYIEIYKPAEGAIINPWALTADEAQIVLARIIEASGRSSTIVNYISKIMYKADFMIIFIMLTALVWDIVESENPTLTTVKNIVNLASGVGGAVIGTEIGVLVGNIGGPIGVFIGAVFGSIIGGFTLSKMSDIIVDTIIGFFCFHRKIIPLELKTNLIAQIKDLTLYKNKNFSLSS